MDNSNVNRGNSKPRYWSNSQPPQVAIPITKSIWNANPEYFRKLGRDLLMFFFDAVSLGFGFSNFNFLNGNSHFATPVKGGALLHD